MIRTSSQRQVATPLHDSSHRRAQPGVHAYDVRVVVSYAVVDLWIHPIKHFKLGHKLLFFLVFMGAITSDANGTTKFVGKSCFRMEGFFFVFGILYVCSIPLESIVVSEEKLVSRGIGYENK